jgi:hypothetical protein
MPKKRAGTIEFIDGPFDGYVEPLNAAARSLPSQLVCFISNNVYRLLDGLSHDNHCRITSVAIYERRCFDGRWTYAFIRSVAPDQVKVHADQVSFDSKGGGPIEPHD